VIGLPTDARNEAARKYFGRLLSFRKPGRGPVDLAQAVIFERF